MTAQTKTAFDQSTLVHITSQGKGGVFKSGIASLVAQYLQDKQHAVSCFDTDPTNATLTRFTGLNVTRVSIAEGNTLIIRKFDELANRIVNEDGPFVVDTGASNFMAFWDYVAQNGLIEFFASHSRRVIVHCPVMGGGELEDTVKGLAALCEVMPEQSIVVWLNSFHGATVNEDGKPFEEFGVVQKYGAKFLGIVRLSDEGLQRQAMQDLMTASSTFHEAMDETRDVIGRHRLHSIRTRLWSQLEAIL